MKGSKTTVLSKFELEIMHVIWDKGKATVQEVKDTLSEAHPGAYSTTPSPVGTTETLVTPSLAF